MFLHHIVFLKNFSSLANFKLKYIRQSENLSHFRWSLDYENDMRLIREIIKRISNRPILVNDIIQLLDNNPQLYKINKITH